jgi:hypothetical protein
MCDVAVADVVFAVIYAGITVIVTDIAVTVIPVVAIYIVSVCIIVPNAYIIVVTISCSISKLKEQKCYIPMFFKNKKH